MKHDLIFIVPKAPVPEKGRYGHRDDQDWHQTCIDASILLSKDSSAKILLITDLSLDGNHEMHIYHGALRKLSVCEKRIICVMEGLETIRQLEIAKEKQEDFKGNLTICVTWVHYFRVRLLCLILGIRATFVISGGIPRPQDVRTEMLLFPIFPLFFSERFRKWFREKAENRRLANKL